MTKAPASKRLAHRGRQISFTTWLTRDKSSGFKEVGSLERGGKQVPSLCVTKAPASKRLAHIGSLDPALSTSPADDVTKAPASKRLAHTGGQIVVPQVSQTGDKSSGFKEVGSPD